MVGLSQCHGMWLAQLSLWPLGPSDAALQSCCAATQSRQLVLSLMDKSEFPAPELVKDPLSALVFLSFSKLLRNEV